MMDNKISDWAWQLYVAYLTRHQLDINCFYTDKFKICLKHAERLYKQAQQYLNEKGMSRS